MKRCVYCKGESYDDDEYCSYCGKKFEDRSSREKNRFVDEPEVIYGEPEMNSNSQSEMIRCPRCQSTDLYLLTRESSGFAGSNACCGDIIFGPLGLLCGLSGKSESETVRKCQNCGQEF